MKIFLSSIFTIAAVGFAALSAVFATPLAAHRPASNPNNISSPADSASNYPIEIHRETAAVYASGSEPTLIQASSVVEGISAKNATLVQKAQLIDPKLRSITPLDYIDHLEMTGALVEEAPNYYSVPGRIYLTDDPDPKEGKLFFTEIEGKLVLTSDRSQE